MNSTAAPLTGRWTFDCLFCEFGKTFETKDEAKACKTEHMAWHQSFYASARAIDALCPMCKREQSSPSCERREHWG